MRILLTGAAGRLGRPVLSRLESVDGIETIATRGTSSVIDSGFHVDLADLDAVERLVGDVRPDVIVHLAAIVGGACERDKNRTHTVNVEATRVLAASAIAAGASRFVFASSSAVYGEHYSTPVAETGRIDAHSTYAQSKFEAECALRAVTETTAGTLLDVTVLRIFNIFGDEFTDSLIWRLLHSNPKNSVALRGLDNFVRDYVHADDVADAVLAAAGHNPHDGFEVINIGSGVPVSNRDLIERIRRRHEPHFTVEPGEPSFSVADVTRAHARLGFSATIEP